MEAYAVVETGGKQYRVTTGDTFEIERLAAPESGADVELSTVLAISDGNELKIGTPYVDGAKVVLTIVEDTLGEKVVNFKKRRRKGYARKVGHRQKLTKVTVKSIA
jgi:large subunit ribosomal protein L21